MEITVLKNVMAKNNKQGNDNRRLFIENGVYAINFLSSPGSGKTTLLENTLGVLTSKYKSAVIEGDLHTSRDAERLTQFNIPLTQINTEGGCHLDASMIHEACQGLDLKALELLLIENVGNLVCPSEFDLGETLRVLLYAVTEGADKPKKYANIFSNAHVVLINKIDLAELCQINLDEVEEEIREINPTATILRISALHKNTLGPWLQFLEEKLSVLRPY